MAEAIAFDIAAELVTKLSSRALSQIGLWWNLKDDLDDLKRTVSTIKAVLLDAEEKSVTNNLVKVWLEELKDVLYDADDLLDDFSTEALQNDLMGGNKLMKEVRLFFSSSNQFAYGLKMGLKIKAIKARLASIGSEANTFGFMVRDRPVETSFMTKKRQKTHSFKDKIIGREDDKAALLKLVLEFENVFDVKIIVENIIKSITGQAPDQNLEMDQLQKQLRDKIGGKKYLLVLDDIWNEEREEWVSLKELLVGGAKGSRIIITTRSFKVAKITSKCQPHVLKGLSDDDAWSLFKEIAFEQRHADSTNSAFVEIGKQILERCSGVPLVIRTIACTLSYKETEKEWSSFKDNELVRISQNDGKILPTLKLSYDHLPSHLKHCFAYCRLYPKDHEIHTLVERSFFQEVGERYPGEGLRCKMHDLMHDLAELVAGSEISIVDSNNIASKDGEKCRHISIDPSLIHLFKGKKLRTLLLFRNVRTKNLADEIWDLIIANCRCLRVLKLDYFKLEKIPRSIYKLKHLRYLDLSHNSRLRILPKSICKIQNLQVLKLDWCLRVEELPKKMEKLVNLTHFGCKSCYELTHMPCGIGKLSSLETLSMFVVDKDGSHGGADLSELRGLNNLRGELEITNLGFVKNAKEKFKAANLKEKQYLRSLLEIHGCTELEYMDDNSPKGSQGEPGSFFPSLKYLCLENCPNMKSWWRKRSTDDSNEDDTTVMAFPCLSSLKIENCLLTSMPLYPSLDDKLELVNTSSRPLKQTMKMNMNAKTPSSSTSSLPLSKLKSFHVDNNEGLDTHTLDECLQHLTSLKRLEIWNCKEVDLEGMHWESLKNLSHLMINNIPQLVSLPLGLQHLVQLKTLKILNCSGLRSLFPVLEHLTFLEDFEVRDCKELELSAADFRIFQDHTSLRYLSLVMIPKCRHLLDWLQEFHKNRRNSPIEGKM
ncbi:hypothetical protein GOBAR_AA32548 [Gossypium barbadense]|uniref:Rx N-terminal domain-containing protein n=1 Tax=Gossypium barbadense TaxID=3634 RepID=A0A2P5WAM6_GOSBA|nr:hypothetical protein GOBAR_AA32548 [Gossypium barbadense]